MSCTDDMLDKHGLNRTSFNALLREVFPHGHPEFLPTTIAQLELHSEKNHDYALGGSPLGNFERVAAILALYPGLNPADKRVVALTYALKQLDAVLWGIAKGIRHKVEGLIPRLQDIAVYANIVICMVKDEKAVAAKEAAGGTPTQLTTRELQILAQGGTIPLSPESIPSEGWRHPEWNPGLKSSETWEVLNGSEPPRGRDR